MCLRKGGLRRKADGADTTQQTHTHTHTNPDGVLRHSHLHTHTPTRSPSFHPRRPHQDSVIMFRKLAVVTVIVFLQPQSANLQVLSALGVIITAMLLQVGREEREGGEGGREERVCGEVEGKLHCIAEGGQEARARVVG